MKIRMVGFKDIHEDHLAIAKQCAGIVEADSFCRLKLWQDHAPNSDTACSKVTSWKERLSGGMFQLGEIAGMPVCVEFFFDCIDGHWVMFYNACSQVTDERMVEEWLKTDMKHARHTDAMNFHIVLHHIRDLNKPKS